MVIEGGVATRNGFKAIVKVEHDFVERQFVSEHDARGRKIFEVFLDAALVLAKLQNSADGIVAGNDHGLNDGLFDHLDVAGIGKFCGAIDFDGLATDASDSIANAGRGGDEVQTKLALETFLHNFHVQQTEKSAAIAKAERSE